MKQKTKSKNKFPDEWNSDKNNNLNKSEDIFPEVVSPKSPEQKSELFAGGIKKKIAREEFILNSKEKLSVIRKFVQALSEISPLVDLASNNYEDEEDFHSKITSLVSLQGEIVGIIGGEWELNDSKINDRYILSIIAKQTSQLIKEGVIKTSADEKIIIAVLDKIDDFIEKRPYIGELIEDNLLSEDILVNIKSSLFPASLKFYNLLHSLRISKEQIYKWLKWQNDLTINLAKDLAFHWDKSANFKDRERMFESSIPYCSEITHNTWIELFIENIKTDLTSFDSVSILNNLTEFENEVKQCDMGYLDHDEYSMDWLKSEVCSYIKSQSDDLYLHDSKELNSNKIKLYFIDYYCKNIAKSWVSTSNSFLAKIEKMFQEMSDEEQEKWMEEDGSKPMSLDNVYKEMEKNFTSNIFEKKVSLDELKLLKLAKGKLAMLWGLSDAVCKIRRVDNDK